MSISAPIANKFTSCEEVGDIAPAEPPSRFGRQGSDGSSLLVGNTLPSPRTDHRWRGGTKARGLARRRRRGRRTGCATRQRSPGSRASNDEPSGARATRGLVAQGRGRRAILADSASADRARTRRAPRMAARATGRAPQLESRGPVAAAAHAGAARRTTGTRRTRTRFSAGDSRWSRCVVAGSSPAERGA
jgi:hypothetical protein